MKIPVKSPEQKDEAQRKVKKEIPRKWHRKVSQKTMSENYERKLLPSILSRQNVLTYRNTSYLKTRTKNVHKYEVRGKKIDN